MDAGFDSPLRILIVEDDEDDYILTRDLLEEVYGRRLRLDRAASYEAGLEALARREHDLCLLDYRLGARDGLELLREATELGCRAPIILLTGQGDRSVDLEATQAGAADFLVKGQVDAALLERSIRYAIASRRAEEAQRLLAEAGRELASSLDFATTLQAVARLVVASHADLCAIDVLDDEGRAERVAEAYRDPRPGHAAGGAHTTGDVGPAPAAAEPGLAMPHGIALRELARQVLDTGEPVLRTAPATADGGRSTGFAPVDSDPATPLTSAIGVPLVARGRVLGALVLGTTRRRAFDSADLALAEELARRAAAAIDNARLYHEARQAVAARDGVLGIVSHDLRNPVLAVSMVADALRGLLPDGKGQEYIAMIKRTMAEMDRLIEDLLDVTRIDAGRLPIEPEPHSAAALVAEAVELLRPVALERSQILEVSVAENLPAVHADRSRVLQVLSNLVGNAVKFSPEGGRITLNCVAAGAEVRFSIADSGPGIPEEHLPRIFDRFWQARHVRRGGAGLGLSIARGIVEAHGGRIWVESSPGAGATFHFTLPRATAAPTPA